MVRKEIAKADALAEFKADGQQYKCVSETLGVALESLSSKTKIIRHYMTKQALKRTHYFATFLSVPL